MANKIRVFSGSDPDYLDKKISEWMSKFPTLKILFVTQSESMLKERLKESYQLSTTNPTQTIWHGTISIVYQIGE